MTCGSKRISLVFLLAIPFACDRGSSGGGPVGASLDADVTFPPLESATDANSVVVRGTATSGRPIQSVAVNGTPATSNDGFATWQALVPLQPGVNNLVVSVTDVRNRTKASAATLTVTRVGPLSVDPIDLSLEDDTHALVLDARRNAVDRVDLTTGVRTVISSPFVGAGAPFATPAEVAATPGGAVAFVAGVGTIWSIDVPTGDRTVIADDTGIGSGPQLGTMSDALVSQPGHLLVTSVTSNSVLDVDVATGDRVEVSGPAVGTGPLWSAPDGIATHPTGLFVVDRAGNALFDVDATTGDRTLVSDDTTGAGPSLDDPVAVAWDPVTSRALVVSNGSDAVIAVDVTTGDRTLITGAGAGSGTDLVDPVAIAVISTGTRAVVLDAIARDDVVLVELPSGQRNVVSGSGAGSGPGLVNPVDLDRNPVVGRLYVLDPGQDAVLAVGEGVGDRSFVSENVSGTEPPLTAATALAFDSSLGRVLATAGDSLIAVDLDTGLREVFSGPANGTGFLFDDAEDLAIDLVGERVFVANGSPPAIYGVDRITGDRTVRSDATTGSGPAFVELSSLAWDANTAKIYVTDPAQGILFSVDPVSGDRTIVADSSSAPDLLGALALELDLPRSLAYVSTPGRVIAVSLQNGTRVIRSEDGVDRGPFLARATGLQVDADGDLLWAVSPDSNAIYAIDAEEGDRVFLSR